MKASPIDRFRDLEARFEALYEKIRYIDHSKLNAVSTEQLRSEVQAALDARVIETPPNRSSEDAYLETFSDFVEEMEVIVNQTFFDIDDLALPVAVWKAVEGQRSDLIALLRSDTPLTKADRNALADWLEGSLLPVSLPPGAPPKSITKGDSLGWFTYRVTDGHDTSTEMGRAGWRYDKFRQFIRKKGWHKKSAGRLHWSSDKLKEAICARYEIDLESFHNYINRSRKPGKSTRPSKEDYRTQIAWEIHHKKTG